MRGGRGGRREAHPGRRGPCRLRSSYGRGPGPATRRSRRDVRLDKVCGMWLGVMSPPPPSDPLPLLARCIRVTRPRGPLCSSTRNGPEIRDLASPSPLPLPHPTGSETHLRELTGLRLEGERRHLRVEPEGWGSWRPYTQREDAGWRGIRRGQQQGHPSVMVRAVGIRALKA